MPNANDRLRVHVEALRKQDSAAPISVLIIGAGAAGLTAGHVLDQLGVEFEILEAAETYGGRLQKTTDFADFPIDLGGEMVHPWAPGRSPVLHEVMRRKHSDFKMFKWRPSAWFIWQDGRLRESKFVKYFARFVMQDYRFANSTWFDVFEKLICPSIKDRIRLNSPVTEINYECARVRVKTASGTVHEADKVLVTVPITILQNESILFSPALPESKLQLIKKESMPDGIKVLMEFSERFYPDMLLCGGEDSDKMYWNESLGKDTSRHVLVYVDGTPESRKYKSMGSDDILQCLLRELDEMFKGRASATFVKGFVQNWSAAPFIQGGWSHAPASKLAFGAKKLVAPLDGKVYFAGEAMNEKGHSTVVHGASESAYLSLERLLRDHRKILAGCKGKGANPKSEVT
jgi:monoamine oxidase